MLEYQRVCSSFESVFALPLNAIYSFETAFNLTIQIKNETEGSDVKLLFLDFIGYFLLPDLGVAVAVWRRRDRLESVFFWG